MKKFNTLIKCVALLVMSAVTLASCNKNTLPPAVTLEAVSADMGSVTFKINATNASETAYVVIDNIENAPSAKGILTAGTKVSAAGEEVTLSDLTPGTPVIIAAAAVADGTNYSNVATLEMSTTGINASVTISIQGTTSESIAYSVTPSGDDFTYIVASLNGSEYANADDNTVYEKVLADAKAAAEAAGQSLQAYLSGVLATGQSEGTIASLQPETQYTIVAFGMNAEDGAQLTPMARENATTTAVKPEMTFELSYSDVTATTAHVTVTPSNNDDYFIWLCQPASSYADYTEEDANEIAATYAENNKNFLDQGIGLYKGPQEVTNFGVASGTKYYLFAFAYTPGIGITSECELVSFTSEKGIEPEDFEAEVTVKVVTATRITFSVFPAAGSETIYYNCGLVPSAEYDLESAKEGIASFIEEYYNYQLEYNPGYTMMDAVEATCLRGEEEYVEFGELTPATEYTFFAIPVSNDGVPADLAVTLNQTTSPESATTASFTAEIVAKFHGPEVDETGYFDKKVEVGGKPASLCVAELSASEDAVEFYYSLVMGDYTNPEEEYKTDDDLISIMYWYKLEGGIEENPYLFLSIGYKDYYNDYTLLTYAKDANGNYGKVSRERIIVYEADEKNPIEDLDQYISSSSSEAKRYMIYSRNK